MNTNKNYGRIRNSRENLVPVRALVLVIISAIIFRIVLANSVGGEQKLSCKGARTTIAILEQNYERKYHHYIVGDEEALQELVRAKITRGLICFFFQKIRHSEFVESFVHKAEIRIFVQNLPITRLCALQTAIFLIN